VKYLGALRELIVADGEAEVAKSSLECEKTFSKEYHTLEHSYGEVLDGINKAREAVSAGGVELELVAAVRGIGDQEPCGGTEGKKKKSHTMKDKRDLTYQFSGTPSLRTLA